MSDYTPPLSASRARFLNRVSMLCSSLRWDFGEPDTTGWSHEDGARCALYRDRYYGGMA